MAVGYLCIVQGSLWRHFVSHICGGVITDTLPGVYLLVACKATGGRLTAYWSPREAQRFPVQLEPL